MKDLNQLVIFAEGMTSNGHGIFDFKRGPFDLKAPIKMCRIKYHYSRFNPSLNFISMADSLFMTFCQYKQKLELISLKGCYYPKEFTTWEAFAQEAKLLMCLELDLEDYSGHFKQRNAYEKEHTPEAYIV